MARIPIIMPKMSMTMTEGEVSTWLVKVGDQVNEGDVVAEVMTDKVDMEVESTHSGTLVEIAVEEGMVAVGDPIGYLEGEESGFGDLLGGGSESPAEDPAPEPAAGTAADTDATPDVGGDVPADPPVPGRGEAPSQPQVERQAAPEPDPQPEQVAAVPRARGLARELGLELAGIRGTGPEGLVTVTDVEAAGGSPAKQPATTAVPPPPPPPRSVPEPVRAEPAEPAAPAAAAVDAATATTVKRKPVRDRTGLIRAAVARKMIESASVPQITVWRDIVIDEADGRRQGLSWTTVLLRAYAAALRDVPELLCRWENDAPTPSGPPAVALAVATPGGLMVPVFSEPDTAAARELDAEIKSVVAAVQQGRLDPAYLSVANGSLSNLGGLGVDRFQALVTPPQASVLALGSIKRRPPAVPGGVGVALTLTAGVTIDHRVADGAHAATLLDRFVAHLG
jgi:pyruvate dehydrogenase E2 component (dihydrolipoamide acetyltransferase)